MTAQDQGRGGLTVRDQVALADSNLLYTQFLTWRGLLDREPPRRPDPAAPAAPPSYRSRDWKFGLVAGRCLKCSTLAMPPHRVCLRCQGVDTMVDESLVDVPGHIVTFSIDRLAWTPSPPLVVAVIDFDGGGRFTCELTDTDGSDVAVGGRVEMTFRRVSTAGPGIHNYFWKARRTRLIDAVAEEA